MRTTLTAAAAAVALAGCGGEAPQGENDAFPPTDPGVATVEFPPGNEVELVVGGGRVVFVALMGPATTVRLEGIEEATIREGTCDEPGEVVHRLEAPENRVDKSLVELAAGRFAVHAGDACTEIESAPPE